MKQTIKRTLIAIALATLAAGCSPSIHQGWNLTGMHEGKPLFNAWGYTDNGEMSEDWASIYAGQGAMQYCGGRRMTRIHFEVWDASRMAYSGLGWKILFTCG